jgi:endonuclease G
MEENTMKIDSMEMAHSRLALHQAVATCLFDRFRKIRMVDIGMYEKNGRVENRLAIRFHVDEFIPNENLEVMGRTPLQTQPIYDIPTVVLKVGQIGLQQFGWRGNWWRSYNPRTTRVDPLQGGVSISTAYYYSGTLGGIVLDRMTKRPMILSNWHVLGVYWGAPRGQQILQPGRYDGGRGADVIATLERDAMWDNLDAAVAVLAGNRLLRNNQLEIGSVTGVTKADLGMQVEKSGRSSGRTFGVVTGIDGVLRLNYGWLEHLIRDIVNIGPIAGEVSRGGDSGSWWLDSTSKNAIGLHFAGGNNPEHALAIEMQSVLDALNVDIAL